MSIRMGIAKKTSRITCGMMSATGTDKGKLNNEGSSTVKRGIASNRFVG